MFRLMAILAIATTSANANEASDAVGWWKFRGPGEVLLSSVGWSNELIYRVCYEDTARVALSVIGFNETTGEEIFNVPIRPGSCVDVEMVGHLKIEARGHDVVSGTYQIVAIKPRASE